jgi:quercetin dioxygenase-like cupin family protein
MSYFYSADERDSKVLFGDITARTFWGEKMLMSIVDLPPHSVVPLHSHPHEQVGYLLKGQVTFTIGGEKKLLKEGDMWVIPGGVEHMVEAGDEAAVALDIFSPPREEYKY